MLDAGEPADGTLQRALGRRNPVRHPRIDLDRIPQRPGQRLERGLGDVVVVVAVEGLDVQRHARRSSRRPGTTRGRAGCPSRRPCGSRTPPARRGTAGPTHRSRRGSAPRPSAGPTTRSGGCPACRRAPSFTASPSAMPTSSAVWWKSMWRSPLARTVMSQQRVLGELVQHVVEKADAGRNVVRAGAVEVHRHRNLGLVGLPLYRRFTHGTRLTRRAPS